MAILLIDFYRAVYVLSGGDPEWIHHFMNTYNNTTRGVPIEQIQSISGLATIRQVLDATKVKI
nr:antitoxin Xre/MbcA/ParS toxin-binding domain-containing protein [Acinetobacter soli]